MIAQATYMHGGHLVVGEQTLDTAAIRNGDTAGVRMSDDGDLEDARNRVANAVINGSVAENAGAPLDEGLHDVHLSGEREDRDLLRTEVHDRNAAIGSADVPAQ